MRQLRKFLRLPSTDRRLLVGAAGLLGAFRLGLWLLPFRALRRLLAGVANLPGSAHPREASSADRVVWAVRAASWLLPGGGSCLSQALTTQILLARRGHPARLHIGVTRGHGGRLEAHAWVESRGKVVIGGPGIERYTPLATLAREGS